jgi:hypothetical protein
MLKISDHMIIHPCTTEQSILIKSRVTDEHSLYLFLLFSILILYCIDVNALHVANIILMHIGNISQINSRKMNHGSVYTIPIICRMWYSINSNA